MMGILRYKRYLNLNSLHVTQMSFDFVPTGTNVKLILSTSDYHLGLQYKPVNGFGRINEKYI